MTRTVKSVLHHRPFATLLRPSADDATVSAVTVRAESRVLVTTVALSRRDGADLLARLGLQVCRTGAPYRWAIAVTVPVAVTITAPNDRYSVQAGVGHLVTALGWLRTGYLTQPGVITVPTDHPAHRSLTGLTCRRTEACPGYPIGGVHRISADARLATMVSADTTTATYAAATARLTADFANIAVHVQRMRHLGAHRFTGLEDPPIDTSANSPDPGVAAPACRAARRDPR